MNLVMRIGAVACTAAVAACGQQQPKNPALTNPTNASATAPDSFRVAFETSKGTFVVQAVRSWAPLGVDRFWYLASNHYYDGNKFFRVLPGFVVQFGLNGDPAVNAAWKEREIPDDSVTQSNRRGYVTYATGGPDTRSTQVFINLADNQRLDAMGFAPFGKVVQGMEVVDSLNGEYGEGAPGGTGPDQDRIEQQGNAYLDRFFPRLDSIVATRVIQH